MRVIRYMETQQSQTASAYLRVQAHSQKVFGPRSAQAYLLQGLLTGIDIDGLPCRSARTNRKYKLDAAVRSDGCSLRIDNTLKAVTGLGSDAERSGRPAHRERREMRGFDQDRARTGRDLGFLPHP